MLRKLSIIYLLLCISCNAVSSDTQKLKDLWKHFESSSWKVSIIIKEEVYDERIDATTDIFLSFQKDSLEVFFAIYSKDVYPNLASTFYDADTCIFDSLSGEHGQVHSLFDFENAIYIIQNVCGYAIHMDTVEFINLSDLRIEIFNFKSRKKL